MSSATEADRPEMLTDLLEQLGGISPDRVVSRPPPGTATEADLLALLARTDRLYELVDGTLVEKCMGFRESVLALTLAKFIGIFLDQHDLGILAGEAGMMRLMAGLVRMPDVSFVRWEKLPGRCLPDEPIPDLGPDLAIEVLSKGNTRGEMQRKLKEYFLCGAELVWLIDPVKRTAAVYTSPDEGVVLTEQDTLEGGKVLPGFSLPLTRLFERLPPA